MAKAALARYAAPPSYASPQQIVVRMPSTPTKRRRPVYDMSPGRKVRRRGGGGKRRGKGRGKGVSLGKVLGGVALASGLIGLLERTKILDNIPAVPLIGKKGLVALGAWALHHFGVGGEVVKDVAVAATALATYQLGKENQITGDFDTV